MNNTYQKTRICGVVKGLESTQETPESARENLELLGYDVDAEYVSFRRRFKGLIHKHTWKEAAITKNDKFKQKIAVIDKWSKKSNDEINLAYQMAQDSEYALAARNLENLTRAEKIAILEDKELLDEG